MLLKPSNKTYTYDNGEHGNDDGKVNYTYENSRHGNEDAKVNYVADNKMPQQMAFHGVVCCLHRCQIVIHLWSMIL